MTPTTAKVERTDELHSYNPRDEPQTTVQAIRRSSGVWHVFWPEPHTDDAGGGERVADDKFRERFRPKSNAAVREYEGRNGTPVGEPTSDGWLSDYDSSHGSHR